MDWVRTINDAIKYMEDNLTEDITLADISKAVNLSAFHFQRAFTLLTGMSPAEYLRKRRLSQAGSELAKGDGKVIDIALKYCYDSPESFTKAFTRFHGVAPKTAREEAVKLTLFNPLTITISVKGGKSMDYRIVQTKEKKFIALVREFSNGIINDEANHDVADFWEECNRKQMLSPIWMLREDGKRDLYGLCTPTTEGKDTFEYGIGIIMNEGTAEFDRDDLEKKGFRIWDVNPGTYVVFECVGEDGDCIAKTWEMFYKEFLPQMGYEASEETDYELYFDGTRPDIFCELWIPVKKK
jgi:AraC family transcriptional regulator